LEKKRHVGQGSNTTTQNGFSKVREGTDHKRADLQKMSGDQIRDPKKQVENGDHRTFTMYKKNKLAQRGNANRI